MTKPQRECLEYYKISRRQRPWTGLFWSRRHQTWARKQGFIVVAKSGNWHNITAAGRKALAGAN